MTRGYHVTLSGDTYNIVPAEVEDLVTESPSHEVTQCPCSGVCCNAVFGEQFTGCRGLDGAELAQCPCGSALSGECEECEDE